MGQKEDNDKDLDIVPINLSKDEIIMLAYAVEYECNDEMHSVISDILEKIEHGLHVDTYVGSRLSEHGRIMGWSKEL